MKANYKDNPGKNLLVYDTYIRMHVFEPDESVNKEDWYKDLTTFKNANCFQYFYYIVVGDIVEDDTGARFKVISRHWKWDKTDNGNVVHVLEFTVERYMRHGKQNPYMI